METTSSSHASSLPARLCRAALVIFAVSCFGCAGTKDPIDGSTLVIERENVTSWDPINLWAECANAPNHYFPRGMKKGMPLDEKNGRWVVDPQDGYCFYVPHKGKSPHSEVLLDQAIRNATNKHSKKMFPLLFVGGLIDRALKGPVF